jgi:uncharacterized membrane protein YvlD (DUF360 family)
MSKDIKRRVLGFVLFWVVSSFTFLTANVLFPNYLALGNVPLNPSTAAIVSGLILALIASSVEPAFAFLHIHVKHDLSWALVFFVVNTEVIWALARFADLSGIGIPAFWVALVLGFVVNLLQWGVWVLVQKVFS